MKNRERFSDITHSSHELNHLPVAPFCPTIAIPMMPVPMLCSAGSEISIRKRYFPDRRLYRVRDNRTLCTRTLTERSWRMRLTANMTCIISMWPTQRRLDHVVAKRGRHGHIDRCRYVGMLGRTDPLRRMKVMLCDSHRRMPTLCRAARSLGDPRKLSVLLYGNCSPLLAT